MKNIHTTVIAIKLDFVVSKQKNVLYASSTAYFVLIM